MKYLTEIHYSAVEFALLTQKIPKVWSATFAVISHIGVYITQSCIVSAHEKIYERFTQSWSPIIAWRNSQSCNKRPLAYHFQSERDGFCYLFWSIYIFFLIRLRIAVRNSCVLCEIHVCGFWPVSQFID